jgi:hypothetical protein
LRPKIYVQLFINIETVQEGRHFLAISEWKVPGVEYESLHDYPGGVLVNKKMQIKHNIYIYGQKFRGRDKSPHRSRKVFKWNY